MNWLRKVEPRQTPSGAEILILKKLPRIALVGTLLVLAMPVLVRVVTPDPAVDFAKQVRSVDIFAIAAEFSLLTLIVTVAIGCVVVHIMKGPAYAADSLPVAHADRPKPHRRRGDPLDH